GRIVDRLERLEFDAVKRAFCLLDPTNVDVLNDIASLRIDRYRATRAFPRHPLHRLDEPRTVSPAFGHLHCLIDEMHAVVGPDTDEVQPHLAVGHLEGCY